MKPRGLMAMSNKELEYYRKNFNEASMLHGKIGKLYQVDSVEQVNTDEYYNHKAPIEVAYTLNENPKRSQLLKLGWYIEGELSKPILATLTYLDVDNSPITPTEGAILEISVRNNPHDLEQFETQKFDIVAVVVDYDLRLFNCNLVPHRKVLRPASPTPTKDDMFNENQFLKRKVIGVDDLR